MARGIPTHEDLQGGIAEYSFEIVNALRNGLSPDSRMPRNSEYADTLQNLRATEFGAVTPETISHPWNNTQLPIAWGSTGTPMLFMGERNRYVAGQTQLYSATSSWALSAFGSAVTAGGIWQAVFFDTLPYFTNGTVFVYGSTPTSHTTVTIQALGRHNNRMLLGGLAGNSVFGGGGTFIDFFNTWRNTLEGDRLTHTAQAWDTGFILFGERGGGSSDRPFDAVLSAIGVYGSTVQSDLKGYLQSEMERYNWGIMPTRTPGSVLAFWELEDAPIAFGESGVCRLVSQGNLYMDQRLHQMGIAGRGAVGGDLTECVFVDTNKEAWRIRAGGRPERLRGSAYLSTLTAAQITIAFDPLERTYWIADKTKAYLLDSDGRLSGPFERFPTSLARDGGTLYGVVRDTRSDTSKTTVLFRSMPLDIKERGTKHLSTLQIGQENVDLLAGGASIRYETDDAYVATEMSQATNNDVVYPYPRISFVDAKVAVSGTVPNGESGRIERIEVRYQSEDISHRRGTKGVPTEV